MVKPYLNQVGGKVENDTNLFTGGLNTYENKAFLESNQLPYVMNMTMSKPPAIRTRNSRNTLGLGFADNIIPWGSSNIIKIWAYSQDCVYFIKKIDDTTYKLCVITKPNSYYKYTELHTFNDNRYIEGGQFCYCRTEVAEYLYFGSEDFKCRINLASDNPLNFNEYSDPDHFGIPVWHMSRLWLIKPSKGKIEWSNAYYPDDFTIGYDEERQFTGDSGELFVSSARGKLTGGVSFDDKLMLFCEHSMHLVYGNSGEEQNQNYFTVVDLLGTLGCLSPDHIAVSGARVFWIGDDRQVYEYTGASVSLISRPGSSRNSTLSIGGIDNVFNKMEATKVTANSDKLFIDTKEGYLFVFDAYNRVWWCEDGGFNTMCNFSQSQDNILFVNEGGDIQLQDLDNTLGYDNVYNFYTGDIDKKPINYEFHTRVYGAEGVDLRKTLEDVWVQYSTVFGSGDVYITDNWCTFDIWTDKPEEYEKRYKKIGSYSTTIQAEELEEYANRDYKANRYFEQKRFIVEKMYGQRVNTFQIIVKGTRDVEFFLMKRDWRAQ